MRTPGASAAARANSAGPYAAAITSLPRTVRVRDTGGGWSPLWTVDAYVIVFAGLLIPAGAVGDRYGRKGALLCGLGLFAAGATVSALATGPVPLIAGRGVSGAGAALIMPATMSILVRTASPGHRPRAVASWALAAGLGGFAGNAAGGLIGQYLPWRALFWVMVPLAALLALAVVRTTPRTEKSVGAAIDPLGATLLTGGLVAVLFGIIESPTHGWTSARIGIAFGVGAALVAAFVGHALRSRSPLFDPRVFGSRRLRAATLGTAASTGRTSPPAADRVAAGGDVDERAYGQSRTR
ncbi:MFS transporter [Streptomyces sp. MZ04]|nr:MFS transporter [Streptomyces sp. MZ04]